MTNTIPESQNDWTVHSLNIHGVFFERLCEKIISTTPGWRVRHVNYPVEFPPPNGPWRGKESALDIRAETLLDNQTLITLVVECKKNNPEFVNWVFFPKQPASQNYPNQLTSFFLQNIPIESNLSQQWKVETSIRSLTTDLVFCDDGRETKGDYQNIKNDRNKTKTSNAAIQDAAYQVALASRAIYNEEIEFSKILGSAVGHGHSPVLIPWNRQLIIPVIVTSAELFVCKFEPSDVDVRSGEIPLDKVLLRKCNELVFEYALPKHLQASPANLVSTLVEGKLDMFTRMHVFVVHSSYLSEFLSFSFSKL